MRGEHNGLGSFNMRLMDRSFQARVRKTGEGILGGYIDPRLTGMRWL